MEKRKIFYLLTTVVFTLFLFTYAPEAKAQLYETRFAKNIVSISYKDSDFEVSYTSNNMLSGFNRKKERFIYKVPLDSLLSHLRNREVEVGTPFGDEFITLYIQPKSHPIDLDNFDGESLDLRCEIAYNGRNYNETARFKAFFNDDDQMISTSFSVRINLYGKNWFDIPPEWGEYDGELSITTSEALVPVKTNY